jgi:hypothetical protein
MPDITMCKGENCPKKDTCLRYTALPDKYGQSYFLKSPVEVEFDGTKVKCDMYWGDSSQQILDTLKKIIK